MGKLRCLFGKFVADIATAAEARYTEAGAQNVVQPGRGGLYELRKRNGGSAVRRITQVGRPTPSRPRGRD